MARASTKTLLSLDAFAKVLSINPVHFNGATGGTTFPLSGSCSDVWPQYTWQTEDEIIGREELAQAIHDAEVDISQVLGYSVAPDWVAQEVHEYPRFYRPEMTSTNGTDNRGLRKAVHTKYAKVISPGVRAAAVIDEGATVTYSDPDGDGWNELATITATTTTTNESEVHIYFAGQDGDPEWEIRPVRSKVISGGTVTITADAWLFIDPDLWEAYPTTAGFSPIDVSTTTNYVSTVDVYREYTDTTSDSATFYWGGAQPGYSTFCSACGGTGCAVCTMTSQGGCFVIRDAESGLVAASPATYSATDAAWSSASFAVCRDPDQVKLWYYAGDYSNQWLSGRTTDPMSHYWAQAVTWLAVARLDRPICSCTNVRNTVKELQADLTASSRDSFKTRFESMDIFSNPFGTRSGEVKAWQRVERIANRQEWRGGVV